MNIRTGINLAEAIRLARHLGVAVSPIRKTGEIRFRHPRFNEQLRANGRRKDCPRHVVRFLRRIDDALIRKAA